MTAEQWLPIPGYEGSYSASDRGRIRSHARTIIRSDGKPQTFPERILRQSPNPDGYPLVRIRRNDESNPKTIRVYWLVLWAFVGPCPDGQQRLHADDDKTNNRLENLRYGTPSDNMLDRVRNGIHHHAKQTHCIRGHEFTAENTRVEGRRRRCRRCKAENALARYHAKKSQQQRTAA